jgi:hypothetical protein
MKILVAGIAALAVTVSASPVDAKGFLSGLMRGGARAAARAGRDKPRMQVRYPCAG